MTPDQKVLDALHSNISKIAKEFNVPVFYNKSNMKALTKENFWNEMEQKYPKSMAHFKDWVDWYKKDNNWKQLFNEGVINTGNTYYKAPKYHELPEAMQFGIFYFFMNEVSIIEFVIPTYPSAIIENGLKLLDHAITVSEK